MAERHTAREVEDILEGMRYKQEQRGKEYLDEIERKKARMKEVVDDPAYFKRRQKGPLEALKDFREGR